MDACAVVEDSLRLLRYIPGDLPSLGLYLHQRAGGMIGSLLRLVRSAAIQAILDTSERLTRDSLDAINMDTAADFPQAATA